MKKNLKLILLTLVLSLVLVACQDGSQETVVVGSKDFTEGLIVSEIYALALEDAGLKVDRKMDIAGSLIHTAITNGEIDLYPEYTGTGLLTILKLPMESDPETVYQQVKEGYLEEFDLVWLEQSNANDSQALVIRTDVGKDLGISTISDLQKKADQLRFASQGEFDHREDGLKGLATLYGPFNFKDSQVYDNSLKYEILENNEADVTAAYTSEGALIEKDKFMPLEDDKGFWPPYHLTPVVRKEVLEAHPEIEEVLNKISQNMTTDTLIELNSRVDLGKEDYKQVAKDYYDSL